MPDTQGAYTALACDSVRPETQTRPRGRIGPDCVHPSARQPPCRKLRPCGLRSAFLHDLPSGRCRAPAESATACIESPLQGVLRRPATVLQCPEGPLCRRGRARVAKIQKKRDCAVDTAAAARLYTPPQRGRRAAGGKIVCSRKSSQESRVSDTLRGLSRKARRPGHCVCDVCSLTSEYGRKRNVGGRVPWTSDPARGAGSAKRLWRFTFREKCYAAYASTRGVMFSSIQA